ncbi:MAG: nuclease-related domain-containing protein [Dermatophilaceae bacterium]
MDVAEIKVRRLRYAATCACGTILAQGERAAYDRGSTSVICLACFDQLGNEPAAHNSTGPGSPPAAHRPRELRAATPAAHQPSEPLVLDVGVAGASAWREFARRTATDDANRAAHSWLWRAVDTIRHPHGPQSTQAWKIGAIGEEKAGAALDALVDAGAGYALHDRRVPGKRSNVDHLFIGAAGVFVIDTKHYSRATISVEHPRRASLPDEILKVRGRHQDGLLHAVHRQCALVREALGDTGYASVPVIPALCFVGARLPRQRKNRVAQGVHLCQRRMLRRVLGADGPYTDEQRHAIAMAVASRLRSAA